MSNSIRHRERRRARAKARARAGRQKTPYLGASTSGRLEVDDFRAAVERMTNCERAAWGRGRYPGKHDRDVRPLQIFIQRWRQPS